MKSFINEGRFAVVKIADKLKPGGCMKDPPELLQVISGKEYNSQSGEEQGETVIVASEETCKAYVLGFKEGFEAGVAEYR